MDKGNLKLGFDRMLNADTIIRRQRRNAKTQKKEIFQSIIDNYEQLLIRSEKIQYSFNIDLSKYEESYFRIMDEMFMLSWGQEIYKLVIFYLYERYNEDGTENCLYDINEKEIYLKSSEDLYMFINQLYPGVLD